MSLAIRYVNNEEKDTKWRRNQVHFQALPREGMCKKMNNRKVPTISVRK